MSWSPGFRRLFAVSLCSAVLGAACSSAAPATPTKPAATAGASAPAASPAANPAASPAAAPATSPAASPAAQAAPASALQSTAKIDPSLASAWQGKTVTLVVAENPGGGYDTWAQLTGRFLNKFLPGQPSMIVENMPGASHRIGMNYVYAAKPDGLTLGMVERYVPSYQLRGEGPEEGVRYDAGKVNWIGAPTKDTQALTLRSQTGITDWKQLQNREVVLAQSGLGGPPNTWLIILREALGLKLRPIFGFGGSAAQLLSLDRGETDGIITDWSSIKIQRADAVKAGALVPLVQLGSGASDLNAQGVPTAQALFPGRATDEFEQMRKFAQVPFDTWSRAVLAPPGMDPKMIETLRAAYWQMVSSPEFIAEAEKLNYTIEPTPGETIQSVMAEYMKTPKAIIEKLDGLITAQEGG